MSFEQRNSAENNKKLCCYEQTKLKSRLQPLQTQKLKALHIRKYNKSTTLPEMNIALENQWLEDEFPFWTAYLQW